MNGIRVRPEAIRVPLPLVQQRDDSGCGPAVLLSVLSYYHVPHEGFERARKSLGTTKDGTPPGKLATLALQSGLRVEAGVGRDIDWLTAALNAGRPAVCLIQADGCGHYVAAVGYDRRRLYFMDPLTDGFYGYLPADEFLARWWDCGPAGTRWDRWAAALWKTRPPYTRRAVPVPR